VPPHGVSYKSARSTWTELDDELTTGLFAELFNEEDESYNEHEIGDALARGDVLAAAFLACVVAHPQEVMAKIEATAVRAADVSDRLGSADA
jgi:hypothetical protein